jgi:hypothetical protein
MILADLADPTICIHDIARVPTHSFLLWVRAQGLVYI